MKILLDTNVLLSAAWRDRLPEQVVHFVATSDGCQWIVTAEILSEYLEVLRRPKFGLSEGILQQWSDLIHMRALVVAAPTVMPTAPRDPKDTKFLAAAVATGADYLITSDNDLLQAEISIATRIVTVTKFAESFDIH